MRMQRKEQNPYRIIGAYDSETTNIVSGVGKQAFPILHQLGILDCAIDEITSDNVERHTSIRLFRHAVDLYAALDAIADEPRDYVPVICCHNLGFDMYSLSSWLSGREIKVLAKSRQKPITFSILGEDGKPSLVIWDTAVFAQKSLAYMGDECGYAKLVGDWDYNLIRTPQTPLTDQEIAYAKHDVYALLAWLGYWCRLNPDIDPGDLGRNVLTKTGVVRVRRLQRFGLIRGRGQSRTVGDWWHYINEQNAFSTDDELFSCQASTRGGFTFVARNNASRVFDYAESEGLAVYGYDATSQHPAQMVSHKYPVRFHEAPPEDLTRAFNIIRYTTLDDVLAHYSKPFTVAFYGAFRFENLRLKDGSIFERCGIAPLASARCGEYTINPVLADENEQGEAFRGYMASIGYKDKAENPIYAFGKLEAATSCTLWLTELAAWEVCQAYDFDSAEGLSGYLTCSFDRPPDLALISVMQFYASKNAFKHARECFYANKPIDNAEELKRYGIPSFVVDGMCNGSIDSDVIESTYLGLKADLNALFGIEASNEYKQDTILTSEGIGYAEGFGLENAPKKHKAFYQFGQRIVGWSRIAQVVNMLLAEPHIDTVINGDTDSLKFVVKSENVPSVNDALGAYARAIDEAKNSVCSRVADIYPKYYDELAGIGHYVHEFTTKKFCAAWNKAYCICETDPRDGLEHLKFTLAGVPAREVNKLADSLMSSGWSYAQVCNTFLGYNVTYTPDLTGLNARSFPEWGEIYVDEVTDYLGNTADVCEPAVLCLYPMAKTVNDTDTRENANNMRHAIKNNDGIKTRPRIINQTGVFEIGELINA